VDSPPKVTRLTPPEKQDPSVRFKDAVTGKPEWGTGEGGYKPPTDPGDRMRYSSCNLFVCLLC
jgi:hypothetical protein